MNHLEKKAQKSICYQASPLSTGTTSAFQSCLALKISVSFCFNMYTLYSMLLSNDRLIAVQKMGSVIKVRVYVELEGVFNYCIPLLH